MAKIGDAEFAITSNAGETSIGRLLDIGCWLVGQLLEQLVGFYCPSLTLLQSTRLTKQHLSGFGFTFELPVEPSNGRDTELTAMRLTIGSTMSNRIVDSNSRHVVDAMEVVHAIGISNVTLATKHIEYWRMNAKQLVLAWHRHIGHGNGRIDEEAAVANHQQCDTGVGAVVKRLQTST